MVVLNSFNRPGRSASRRSGLTLSGGAGLSTTPAPATALWTSVKVGLGATAVALVLGTCSAFAVQRYRFFGRDAVSLLVVLPIALPGIVTGIALNSAFNDRRRRRSATSP